jgi:hypothetical protein
MKLYKSSLNFRDKGEKRESEKRRSLFKEQNKNIYLLASPIFQALYLLHF